MTEGKLTSVCLVCRSDVMNEKSVIDVQIFERTVEEEAFLGMCEIRPRLVNGHTVDQWFK